MSRQTTFIWLGIIALFLTGCYKDDPEAMLEDYRDRVANVLEIDVPPLPALSFPTFPHKRDRIWPTKELRTGLLDSMDFAACDLLPLIVERNSSLGKVMQPSSLLSYEVRFFEKLWLCQKMLKSGEIEAEEKVVELIQSLYTAKAENLNAVIWNGIFSSDEITAQFSNSKDPVPLTGNLGFQDSLRALHYLTFLTEQAAAFHQQQPFSLPDEFTQHDDFFFSLYSSEYGGQLQSSLILLINNLQQATDLINLKLNNRPLCFNEKSNKKADILMNIFTKYYAGKVQPYMSLIHRQGQAWFEGMNKLLNFGGEKRPVAMQDFYTLAYDLNSPTSYWARYQTTLKAHTKAWQQVLGQCGLMPS